MLDVAKLATLRAVVEHGSFSAAGEALVLTQPAVSRQVSLLERRLGTQLVRRTRQGVFPTEAGRLPRTRDRRARRRARVRARLRARPNAGRRRARAAVHRPAARAAAGAPP